MTATPLSRTASTPPPRWWVFVADTKTGRVVAKDVPTAGLPRSSARLNTEGALGITVPMSRDFAGPDVEEFLDPWKWSWGLAWGSYIHQYGPLIYPEYEAESECWQLTCAGIWKLFTDKRALINPAWNGVISPPDPSGDLACTDSLRNIFIRLLTDNLQRPDAALPIDLPALDAPGGTVERRYSLSKLVSLGSALEDLTDDEGGPEAEFRPYFPDSQAQDVVRYQLRVGGPHLGQLGYPHAWLSGQALVKAVPARDGARTADTFFVPGQGTDQLTPIGMASTDQLRRNGYPLLEDIDATHTGVTETSTLDSYAGQNLARYQLGSHTIRALVRTDGRNPAGHDVGAPSLDRIALGDTGIFVIRDYIGMRPGTYRCRILGHEPVTPENLQLELQLLSAVVQ